MITDTKNLADDRVESRSAFLKVAWAYALFTLICLAALIWYLDLGNARLDVPFSYSDAGRLFFQLHARQEHS